METIKLEFDIAPVRVPVRIDGQGYVLSKASAQAAAAWRAGLLKHASMDEDGKIKGLGPEIAELDFALLAACLRKATLDDGGKVIEQGDPLTIDEVRALPNDAVAPLADRVREISAMNPKLDEAQLLKQKARLEEQLAQLAQGDAVKNLPSNTTAGSV